MENQVKTIIKNENEVFFANSVSLTNSKTNFIVDFKQSTPRMDILENQKLTTIVIKHNSILIEPNLVKGLVNILTEAVSNYEKQFGKIESAKQQKEKKIKPEKMEFNYIG